MADGDIGSVLDSIEYDATYAQHNRIIKRSNTIALVFYQDTNSDQKLITVEVDAAGEITDTVKDTLIFNGVAAQYLSLAERTPGIYVLHGEMAIGGGLSGSWLATVSVGTAGELPLAILDSLKLSAGGMYDSAVAHLTGNVMVVSDVITGNQAFIRTFACTSSGALGATEIDSYRFLVNTGLESNICEVSDSVVLITSSDSGGELKAWTFVISVAGTITDPEQDSLVIAVSGSSSDVIHLVGNIYVVAYEGPGQDGFVDTISVDSSGNIGAAVIDSYEFEVSDCLDPSICKVSDGIVAIAYRGVDGDGFIRTIAIDAAGNITDPYLDSLEFDTFTTGFQDVVFMQGNVYLIAQGGADYDGFVRSTDIATPAVVASKHLMTIGVG